MGFPIQVLAHQSEWEGVVIHPLVFGFAFPAIMLLAALHVAAVVSLFLARDRALRYLVNVLAIWQRAS